MELYIPALKHLKKIDKNKDKKMGIHFTSLEQ